MLRYLALCFGTAVTLLAFALVANEGLLAKERESQASRMRGDLLVEKRTADSIAGVYGYAGSTIAFNSEFDPSVRTVATSLVINGNAWRYQEDKVAGTSSISGAGNALTFADQDALVGLMTDLGSTDISRDEAPEQEFSLYRTTLFLTEVTPGLKMPTIRDENTNEDTNPTVQDTTPAAWSVSESSSEKAVEECEGAPKVLGGLNLVSSTLNTSPSPRAACQRSDNDDSGPRYPGVDYLTCETKTRLASYDWGPDSAGPGNPKQKCFRKYRIYSGPRQAQCRGRCGKLCGGSDRRGPYTQDCLDHDKCVLDAGSRFSNKCYDELNEVFRDVRAPSNCPRR